MSNVVKLDLPYRSVLTLSDGCAVLPKTQDRLKGRYEVDLAGGDIVLRFEDGHAVTLSQG